MIKNLLTPKWQHPDREVRLRAIEEGRLDDDILSELVKTDPETEIRARAVSRMQNLQTLIELADNYKDAADIGIEARLHELVLAADPQTVPDAHSLQRCNELCTDPQLRQSLLLNAPFASLRQMVAQGIQQDDILEQCVLNDRVSEVRCAAVVQIENEAILRNIARELRGSDKTTARLADEKRTQLQQLRQQAEQQQQLLMELSVYAQGSKPLNEHAIDQHIKHWQQIAETANSVDRERFDALHSELQSQLEQYRQQQLQERESRSSRETILQSLAELQEQCNQLGPETSQSRLEQAESDWRGLESMQNAGLQQHFEQDFSEARTRVHKAIKLQRKQDEIQHRLDAMLDDFEARLQRPLTRKIINDARQQSERLTASIEDRQSFEKPLQRLRNLVEKLETGQVEQQKQQQTLQHELQQHIDALESALQEKALKRALSAHKKAHDLLISAGKTRPPSLKKLEQRLHHCEPALRELKSWRNWGTDHAREELVQEAIALADSPPDNVDKITNKLSDLRKRWKQLGPLEPGGKAHWEHFDAACTRAHEPVKAKHDADTEERKQHLEQRKQLCSQLETLTTDTDWEQPDWHALDKTLGDVRRQWHRTGGVPHKAWPKIRKRFERAVKELDTHLEHERVRNFNYRLGLVHKAEQLALEEDNRAATAAARELRQQWQVSVRSHNRKEKQIWQSFNKAMDQVFNKDRAAREQFRASLDENQHKAETLCKQLEQLSKSDDQVIRSGRAELQQLVDQFTALNLPKRSRRQLETRFDKASKAYRQRAESADNALRQQQLEQLYTLHSLCAQLEAMALGLQAGTHTADDLKSRWEEAARPPRDKSVLHHIEQRCQAAMKVINGDQGIDSLGDLAGNTKRKRALCTDLEILLHVESPEEERGQRMQRQVEILEDAMKGGAQDSSEHIRELKLAFICCGPADADSHENIESRFAQLLQA